MNGLKIWENPEFGELRIVDMNGEPWMVGKDVAQALGYAKPLNAIAAHVDEDDSLKQGITDSLENAGNNPHQRKRPLQFGFIQQVAGRKAVPALGDRRGAAQHPQARRLHEPGDLAAGAFEPGYHDSAVPAAEGRAGAQRPAERSERAAGTRCQICA